MSTLGFTQTVIVQGLWATNALLAGILAVLLFIAGMCWQRWHRS